MPGDEEGVPSVIASLVPYSYPLLDERSGYPAGIRDPEWQRGVFRAAGEPGRLDDLLTATAVRICAAVREAGHPSGPADAREVVRVARDLATLRGFAAAGRGELVEAVQTVLTQGQLLGRGRVVATAMERVLVGDRQGRLAPGTPRSGLGPAVEGLLAELSLPSPPLPPVVSCGSTHCGSRARPPTRDLSAQDGGLPCPLRRGGRRRPGRRRRRAHHPVDGDLDALDRGDAGGDRRSRSDVGTGGRRRTARRRAAERRDGGPTAAQVLAGLEDAARCALPKLASERLTEVAELLPASGTLPNSSAGSTC